MSTEESHAPACNVMKAQPVAEKLLKEIRESLEVLGRKPLLVGFLANADPSAQMYAKWTKKTAEKKWVALGEICGRLGLIRLEVAFSTS